RYIMIHLLGVKDRKAASIARRIGRFFLLKWFGSLIYQEKECVRKLRFIGDGNEFFKHGQIYTSKYFNGATYSFEGYERRIGLVYFDVVEDEHGNKEEDYMKSRSIRYKDKYS
ncbi:MAG: hypothetical protein ABII90_14420, partial [Bacteroidota bacterium]